MTSRHALSRLRLYRIRELSAHDNPPLPPGLHLEHESLTPLVPHSHLSFLTSTVRAFVATRYRSAFVASSQPPPIASKETTSHASPRP